MANKIYPKFKESILQAGVDLSAVNVRAILIDSADYTYSDAHDFLDDVAGGARVAVSGNLGSKTFAAGVFDTADVTFATVSGDVSEALILYVHTGTDGTSRLIAFIDTGITGMPITPDGNDIQVTVDAAGWFTL